MTPNPIECGNVVLGGSTMCMGTLSNSSGGMFDLVVDSNCAGQWSITPTSVNLSSDRVITATFTPGSTAGQSNCTVRIYDKGTTSPERGSFGLHGNGQTPADISVSDPPNFGSVRYNDAAAPNTLTKSINVTNLGDQPLMITNVTVSGGGFSLMSGGTSQTITKGNSKTWVVAFNPSSPAGGKTGTMTFQSNDPDGDRTLNLAGTATTASISVDATEIDYGIVGEGGSRADDIAVKNPTVANGGPLGVSRAVIAGGSWFTFASCSTPNNRDCNVGYTVANGGQSLVGVKCSPPLGVGVVTQTATVTFTSDSDGGTLNVANVKCTSGAILVKANSAAVDFGKKLVIAGGGTAGSMPIMVTNEGNVDANITFALSSGTPNQFSVTCAGGASTCVVGAKVGNTPGTAMVDVTINPTAEGDLFTNLDINLNGGNKNGPSLSLTGHGIDKHLGVLTDIAFADTYRNPGSKAPVELIPVTNTGESTLSVTALGIIGDTNVWSLAEPFTPFDVAPNSSVDVGVKFTPTSEGKAPMAQLHIEANDILPTGMQTINLSGNGKKRNVDLTPGSIDIGQTFAGIPARLSITRPGDILTVINMDDIPFNIRDIQIDGADASAFRLTAIDGNDFGSVDIEPGAKQTFDIVFSPPYPGDFEATVALYLDEDPQAMTPIPIKGQALYVSAHGAGGCSTGGDTGGACVVVVGGVILILRRRRR